MEPPAPGRPRGSVLPARRQGLHGELGAPPGQLQEDAGWTDHLPPHGRSLQQLECYRTPSRQRQRHQRPGFGRLDAADVCGVTVVVPHCAAAAEHRRGHDGDEQPRRHSPAPAGVAAADGRGGAAGVAAAVRNDSDVLLEASAGARQGAVDPRPSQIQRGRGAHPGAHVAAWRRRQHPAPQGCPLFGEQLGHSLRRQHPHLLGCGQGGHQPPWPHAWRTRPPPSPPLSGAHSGTQ
mmetsp:Transcript_518/g.1811  ORF Transcript_518/g.1811 Transcript_518/m.1811 type:complete len:235 (+) Transcript_518:902-1606(+)